MSGEACCFALCCKESDFFRALSVRIETGYHLHTSAESALHSSPFVGNPAHACSQMTTCSDQCMLEATGERIFIFCEV